VHFSRKQGRIDPPRRSFQLEINKQSYLGESLLDVRKQSGRWKGDPNHHSTVSLRTKEAAYLQLDWDSL